MSFEFASSEFRHKRLVLMFEGYKSVSVSKVLTIEDKQKILKLGLLSMHKQEGEREACAPAAQY